MAPSTDNLLCRGEAMPSPRSWQSHVPYDTELGSGKLAPEGAAGVLGTGESAPQHPMSHPPPRRGGQ